MIHFLSIKTINFQPKIVIMIKSQAIVPILTEEDGGMVVVIILT